MAEPESKTDLLRTVRRLTRGLSALFWGLPVALVVSVQASTGNWPGLPGSFSQFAPPLAFALLLYGLCLMGDFQPQERIWGAALERARLLALTNLGLSPFLHWYQLLPHTSLFAMSVLLLTAGSLLFLLSLNHVLWRLAAMLPDETLRSETAGFTAANRWILLLLPIVALVWHLALLHPDSLPRQVRWLLSWLEPARLFALLFIALLPLSVTMSLTWKIKEALLECVFSGPPGSQRPASDAATSPRSPGSSPSLTG